MSDQMTYDFDGDNAHLVTCIRALLAVDAAGSMRPHGVGGLARTLLTAAAERLTALEAEQRVGVVPEDCVVVPKEPSDALLRPFYECPPDELGLAWSAMQRIAGKNAPLPTLTPQRLAELQANERRYLWLLPRLRVINAAAMDGSRRPAIEVRVGGAFFDCGVIMNEHWQRNQAELQGHIDAAIDASGRGDG